MAENQYGHTKIALEEDSDAKIYLIAFRTRKIGGTNKMFSLDQLHKNAFTISVFGHRKFELNLEHLLFLFNVKLSTDILPHF